MAEFTTPKWRDHLFSVVIAGAGPAGMMLAFCLAKMGVNPLIIDNALASEHEWGRGDGMQFRTLEVLRNLGLYDDLEKQSLKVATMSQWAITENPTVRHVTNFAAGDMDIEEKYGLTIRQGIIEKILDKGFEELSPGNKVHRPWSFQDAWIEDRSDPNSLVNVTLRSQYGETRQIRTRYLVGCDGGKSQVRRTLRDRYGVMFEGSPHDSAWGAVDILEPRTNFPDIKRVCILETRCGTCMIIPRENIHGKECIRLYIPSPTMADPNAEPTLEAVTKMLQEAFHPFTMTWEEVNWFTIYKVGQRIASQFDVDRKIFLAGDASHIHSPKAGLGMNTSMMDTHNLAVKLALVLNKVAKPDILATYNLERKRVADQLLAMDAKLIDLFAKHSEAVKNSSKDAQSAAAATNNELFKFQRSQAAYQTGLSITYDESFLVRSPGPNDGPSETVREMGGHGLIPGRRLLPVTVTRYLDGCAMRLLEATQPFDGHFTIFLCLGDLFSPGKMERIQQLKTQIMRPDGLWKRLLDQRYANLSGQLLDSESLFPRSSQHPVFRFVVITSTRNDSMELARHYENIFRPKNSTDPLLFGPEMLFCDNIPAIFYGVDPANMPLEPRILKKPLHEKWDVSEEEGAVVVLRPDGHVGAFVRNLLDRDRYSGSGWSSVEEYFSRFLVLDD